MTGIAEDFGLPVPGDVSLSVTGTTFATALVLTKKMNVLSSVASGGICVLPGSYAPGSEITVMNRASANAVLVAPSKGDMIEGLAVDATVSVPTGYNVTFVSFDPPAAPPPRTWYRSNTEVATGSYLPLAGGTVTGVITATGGISLVGKLNIAGATSVYTLSGTSTTQAPINTNTAGGLLFNGTIGNTGGYLGLAEHLVVGTIADASANGGTAGTLITAQYFTGAKGGLTGHINTVTIPGGQTIADAVAKEFVGGRDTASIASPSGAAAHSIIGRTTVATLSAAATGYGGLGGQEIALQAAAGSSVALKYGQYVMLYAADAVRGSGLNSAYSIWNQYAQGAATGWDTLINLGPGGQAGLFFPGGQDATLIKVTLGATDGPITVASFADWSALTTITGFQLKGINFNVAGTGIITAPKLDNGSTGLTVGAASSKLGFFDAAVIVKPTGVAVTAAGIHAALVSLGLIAA